MNFHVFMPSAVSLLECVTALRTKIAFDVDAVQFFDFSTKLTRDQMQRFLRAGQLDPRPVITHRFPLECIADAIQVIKDGQAGKVILEVCA